MNTIFRSVAAGLLSRLCAKDLNSVLGLRYLYNVQVLGIDKYAEVREITARRFGNMKKNFVDRMQRQVSNSPSSMVFTEDLKAFVHLAEDKPEDLDTFVQMVKKFHKQNQELRFGTFVFGPVVARLLHYLQKPDLMLQLFNDEELAGFFDQIKSFILCMDLLYEHGLYQEVINLNEKFKERVSASKYPRETVAITTAACYKLNTPESCEYASNLVTAIRQDNASLTRKALHFVSALALNQGRPDSALEILTSIQRNNNVTGNNLKLLALARLNRVQDCINFLRTAVSEDGPTSMKIRGHICESVLEEVRQAVQKTNDTEMNQIFEQLCDSLKDDFLTNQALEDFVCAPITEQPFIQDGGRFTGRPGRRFQNFDDGEDLLERSSEPPMRRRSFSGVSERY